jgi:penicillin-binding protein 2
MQMRPSQFELRLKLVLLLFIAGAGVMLARAVYLQVWQYGEWKQLADDAMRRPQLVETTRGPILDRNGRPVAEDRACMDASVDYRAILAEPDARWLRDTARARLRKKRAALLPGETLPSLSEEIDNVRRDLREMWDVLGRMPDSSPEKVEQTRREIVQRVEMRRRFVWYRNYERAMKQHEAGDKPAWYERWLAGESAEGPQLDQFEIEVNEQTEPHAILRAISTETYNTLARNLDYYPGLTLQPGVIRVYPFGDVGAHVIGQLSRVTREDLETDPFEATDELRRYLANDLIGRTGLEALAEPLLRGQRGRIVKDAASGEVKDTTPARPGQSVRTTLDMELQRDVQQLFSDWKLTKGTTVTERHPMHGAAVAIDVATGDVLAMVSYPSYDANLLESRFAELARDEINQPLLHRATMSMYEPGSTMKPVIGLAGVSAGILGVRDTVECTGYLVLGGRKYDMGRCWTMSKFNVGHHTVPWQDPHPNGFLNLEESIQRSCNIYFETIGDRLKIDGLTDWMTRFGLGRPTGLGIGEAAGRIPGQFNLPSYLKRSTSWFASIGQGKVGATPIQMANVAATIARDGIWRRPQLLVDRLPATRPTVDTVDLQLDRGAVAAVRRGMVKVVNTRGGTAKDNKREDVLLAGKTGTAEAAPFTYRLRDEYGNLVYDEHGRVVRQELRLSTPGNPNPQALWYRGSGSDHNKRNHAWFMGFAPADKPTVAFIVMVEYGGSGGEVAGPIADGLVTAAMKHGYIAGGNTPGNRAVGAAPADSTPETEPTPETELLYAAR